MVFKPPNCPKCRNKGYYHISFMPPLDPLDLLPLRLNLGAMPAIWLLLREIDPIAGLLILTSGVDLEGGHTEIVEIACSC